MAAQAPENIASLIQSKAEEFGPKIALCTRGEEKECFTFSQLSEMSGSLSHHLATLGVEVDDRVAILSEARPRWAVAFFAALRVGAIACPLDSRLTLQELGAIVADARPKVLFVSSQTAKMGRKLQQSEHAIQHLINLDAIPEDGLPDPAGTEAERVQRLGDDPAVLTYTSGTMGIAKGVVTTYANLLFQIRGFRTVIKNDSRDACVSILPLSHLFELTVGLLGVLYGGGRICYAQSLLPHEILAAMQEQKVTCMITVPLFLKLLHNGIRKQVAKQSKWRQGVFATMQALAPAFPKPVRRILFRRIHKEFGGCLSYFICGGAPLEGEVLRFFERVGIPVYQGYGMAEASPVISTNAPGHNRLGSVGRPMPGSDVKIDQGEKGIGEILTRGPHVMKGYYQRPDLTQEIVDKEGWLHTGDVGYLDKDGYLIVQGRRKNLIVLGSGKNVHPEELEGLIFDHPDISEGCVLGATASQGITAGTEEVCAIVVPGKDVLERFSDEQDAIHGYMQGLIKENSQTLADWKRPTRIVVGLEELPKTSTRKIKRLEVHDWLLRQE